MAIYTLVIDNISTRFLPYDERRTSLIIRNLDSVNTVYLSLDPITDINNTFPLSAGDALSFNRSTGDDTRVAFYAISPIAPVRLAIIEFFE